MLGMGTNTCSLAGLGFLYGVGSSQTRIGGLNRVLKRESGRRIEERGSFEWRIFFHPLNNHQTRRSCRKVLSCGMLQIILARPA